MYINKHSYVPYSRPNGWTEWAEFLCGHLRLAWGGGSDIAQKNSIFLKTFFFFKFVFPMATPGFLANIKLK